MNKQKKKYNASEIGCTVTLHIYVGQHYTDKQRTLLQTARVELIESGIYKFLWIQNGTILVRGEGDSKIRKIKCEADILKLKKN